MRCGHFTRKADRPEKQKNDIRGKTMKLKKKDYTYIAIAMGLYLLMVLVITRFTYAFGSTLDWSAQHFAIPDNFRRQFYDSGDLFPSFLFNVGAGENIYDLSYYGLFSPVVLLSYLFPFVPMYIYMQVAAVLSVCVSIFLFYRWKFRKFGSGKAFVLTVMFEFATGLSLHSHRHIMFVSYMPFLLLAFGAVEDYFKSKRKYLLVIYTFLCIMCCYFFGVAAVAAIVVYGVYEYLRTTEKVTLKDFWKKGSHFAGRIFTAVLLSGVLLLPTVYCLLKGRDSGNSKLDLSVLIPKPNVDFLCYDGYGMGLTIIAVLAVVSAVLSKNKKHTRFLGITMLCLLLLPVSTFILNGTLYVDAKVLIPFMPLCLLLVGRLGEQVIDKTFNWKLCLPAASVIAAAFALISDCRRVVKLIMAADIAAVCVVGVVYLIMHKKQVLYAGMMVIAIVAGFIANDYDELEPLTTFDLLYSDDMYALTDTISEDSDLVRTANLVGRDNSPNTVYNDDYYAATIYSSLHNKYYNDFYFNGIYNENEFRNSAMTTQSQSFLFQMYMGQRYLITDSKSKPSVMYKKIQQSGNLSLYKCDLVMPVGYCSSNVLNEQAYKDIKYPYSLSALLNNTIVEKGGADSYQPEGITEIPIFEINDIKGIKKTDDGYSVRMEKTTEFKVELPQAVEHDKLLLVSFDVDNDMSGKDLSSDDAKVFIDGIKNNLTDPDWKYYNNNNRFEFVVSAHDEQPVKELKVKFMKGNYEISDIRCYSMDISQIRKVDEFKFDKSKTKGDDIVGSIDVTEDGYFKLSVPYAEGFTAYVDGEKTDVECVDTAFIGFPLQKGHHDIKITFTAPLHKAGIVMSAAGVLILAVLIFFECRKCRKTKEVKQ